MVKFSSSAGALPELRDTARAQGGAAFHSRSLGSAGRAWGSFLSPVRPAAAVSTCSVRGGREVRHRLGEGHEAGG